MLLLFLSLLLLAIPGSAQVPTTTTVLFNADGGPQLAMGDLMSAYQLLQPNVTMVMTKASQTTVILASVTTETADFALDSVGLTNSQAAAYPTLAMYPAMCFALVPIYRVDALGVNAPQLVLTRTALARIYLGQITWWNDTAIQSVNPGLTMPAQRITVVLPPNGVSTTTIFTTAIGKFLPGLNATIAVSTTPAWPKAQYYRWVTGTGPTAQPSLVIANDGSIGYAFHNVALWLQNNIAAMVNQAGITVQPSTESITFAAVELGTAARTRTTASMDLTDGTGSSVWPITMMSFLLIDLDNSRSTCHVRAAAVQFWVWYYSSAIAAGLLATREYAPVPSIVLTQLDVVHQLSTAVTCRGEVALPTTTTTTRFIGAPVSVSFLSTLFATLYASQDSSVVWEVQQNSDALILQQIIDAEVDVAFVDPANVDPGLMQAVVDAPDFLVLPAYLTAVAYIYNPALTSNISITGYNLTLDMATIILINYGCINAWNDPAIVAQNPFLATLLPAFTVTPVPISRVFGCNRAPLGLATNAAELRWLADNPNPAVSACLLAQSAALGAAFSSCTSLPAEGYLFAEVESAVPPLILGTVGGFGPGPANTDPTYGYVLVNQTIGGSSAVTAAGSAGEAACVAGMLSTFSGDLDALFSLDSVSALSSNPACYPVVLQVYAIIRRNYTAIASDATSCTRGYDTLQFMQWWYTAPAIDSVVVSASNTRFTNLSPAVLSSTLTALNAVTCDGATLLVTLPLEWDLAAGVSAFVYTISSLGLAVCAVLAAFIVRYHHHPVVRSASPLFLQLSLLGLAVLFGAGYLLVAHVSTASCAAFSWLVNVGLMMTFAPLFAKTWRIYRIFGRKKLTVVAISNRKLLLMVGGILAVEVLLMAVWQGVGNLQPVVNDVQSSTTTVSVVAAIASRFEVNEYVQCGVPDGPAKTMFIVVCVEKGLLFVWGALMAFTTRKVSSTFNEAQGITLALYNTCFTIGIIAPIILVIQATGDVLDLLLAFALLWIASFTTAILFGPKLITVLGEPDSAVQNNNTSVQGSSSSSSGYAFFSLAALSSVGVLQGYLAALRKHVAQVEEKIAKLRHQQQQQQHGHALHGRSPSLPVRDVRDGRDAPSGSPPSKAGSGQQAVRTASLVRASESPVTASMGRVKTRLSVEARAGGPVSRSTSPMGVAGLSPMVGAGRTVGEEARSPALHGMGVPMLLDQEGVRDADLHE